MRLELGLNQRSLRRWQIEVADRLSALPDVALGIRWSKPVGEELPSCVGTLLALERTVQGRPAGLTAPALPTDLSRHVGLCGIDPDLVIDLSGGTPSSGRRRWRLTFDGRAGDAPILAALLEGRAPLVALSDANDCGVIANARPGIDEAEGVAAGFESVVTRSINLILAAVAGGRATMDAEAVPATISCGTASLRGTKALASAALARLDVMTRRPSHARTGWRFVTGPDLVELGTHPASGWRVLPDDGERCYAQPFPIVSRGETWLFVTEHDFKLGRSLIAAVKFGADGPLGTPMPVLELPFALSYPMVFEAEGTIWMIPTRAGATSIDLYRASRFPSGWRHEACLVADVEASDATVFRFRSRWWMTATVRDGGSSSDMLHVWSADEIRGPWRAHPGNPVLIDASAARPAGRVVDRGGRLIRPVQDLGDGNGPRLALAEIVRLDERGLEQRIVGQIAPAPSWPGRGISTLNRAGLVECIDGADFAVAATSAVTESRPSRAGRSVGEAARAT